MSSTLSRRATLMGAASSLAACATAATAETTGVIEVAGVSTAYRRRGGRGPAVVFESGLGNGLEVWDQTIAELAPGLAFVAYSRPGYGDSTHDGDDVRGSDEAALRLHATLQALRVRGPYLLVGHSLGGLYIAKFADLYPHQTAGLVFVDGRPPRFRALCIERGVSFCDGSRLRQSPPGRPLHIDAESAGVEPSEAIAPADGALMAIPATVITSTNVWQGEGAEAAFGLWLESQEAFSRGFAQPRFVRAEGAGHYVQSEQPALVAREIGALAERVWH